jgi:hypothetical protein
MRKIKEEINMRLFGIPLRTFGKIATGVGNVLSFAVFVLPYLTKKNTTEEVHCNFVVTYDDVILAIVNSSMLSNDMNKAVTLIPKEGNTALYKAIINVINSNMLSGDKFETIKHICKN